SAPVSERGGRVRRFRAERGELAVPVVPPLSDSPDYPRNSLRQVRDCPDYPGNGIPDNSRGKLAWPFVRRGHDPTATDPPLRLDPRRPRPARSSLCRAAAVPRRAARLD